MPRVYVEWVEGRTQEQRDTLAKRITEEVVSIGKVKPEAVSVVFIENSLNNFYKAGVPFVSNK